jgi:hypothetical protein
MRCDENTSQPGAGKRREHDASPLLMTNYSAAAAVAELGRHCFSR